MWINRREGKNSEQGYSFVAQTHANHPELVRLHCQSAANEWIKYALNGRDASHEEVEAYVRSRNS